MDVRKHTGSCLCGGVRYEIAGDIDEIVACHCEQCRKTSGHHVAATRVKSTALQITADQTLKWFRSSDMAERGFCDTCGGNLFWRRIGKDMTSIMAGTLDGPTEVPCRRHIFVKDKADYVIIPAEALAFDEAD